MTPSETMPRPEFLERLRALAVQVWPIGRLLPYVRNARTHSDEQVAQVAASIVEFGWTNPILVAGNGTIIAGHARLAAARKLQMDEVPVIVLDHLTETQRRALVLADNKLAMNAGWDGDMLRVEMKSLEQDGFNLDVVDSHEVRLLDHATVVSGGETPAAVLIAIDGEENMDGGIDWLHLCFRDT
jgi:ParB-like chromosome segregation protein Spo0J